MFILFPNGRGFRQEGQSTGLPVKIVVSRQF